MKPPTLDPRDVLPTIHCAPEICRSCREWIVLQFDLREKAGREEGESWWRAAVEKWASVHFGSVEATAIQEYTGKYGGTPSMMLQSIVAAARLAGRLEQAEKSVSLGRPQMGRPDSYGEQRLIEERDRLRREVEEAKRESS